MINLVICFPIASIQEISTSEVGRTGPHDHSGFRTFRSVFQVTPVAPRTGWSAHLHKASRRFTCLMCGSNVDRYGKGVTGRLWTWKMCLLSSLTILWGSLKWPAFTEDPLMCPYTKYVNCSSCFITRVLTFQSSPICLNALWNLGFLSSCFLCGLTFPLPLKELV